MTSLKQHQTGLHLSVRTGNKLYVVNTSDSEIVMPAGTLIAGFGRGRYKAVKSEEKAEADKEILFTLENQDDLILMNGACYG